jgi:hypothetical protein
MTIKKLTKVEQKTLELLLNRAVQNAQQIPDVLSIGRGLLEELPTSKVDLTLDERGNRYGDFTDHARIAQQLQDVMRNHEIKNHNGEAQKNWYYLDAVKKQALTVLADKIARILNGDPNYADNWHDIQGYAKLVEDRLPKVE